MESIIKDIIVIADGVSSNSTNAITTSTITPSTDSSSTVTTTTPTPTTTTTTIRGIHVYGQCGGKGYKGPNECDQSQNLKCFKKDKFYSVIKN